MLKLFLFLCMGSVATDRDKSHAQKITSSSSCPLQSFILIHTDAFPFPSGCDEWQWCVWGVWSRPWLGPGGALPALWGPHSHHHDPPQCLHVPHGCSQDGAENWRWVWCPVWWVCFLLFISFLFSFFLSSIVHKVNLLFYFMFFALWVWLQFVHFEFPYDLFVFNNVHVHK